MFRRSATGARLPQTDLSSRPTPRSEKRAVVLGETCAGGSRVRGARGSHPDDELEVFGFTEQWEVDMVRFWRDWNDATERHRVRELDIKWLVALGRTDDSFSRVDVVSAGARKLATLLPDANVPNMFQREPAIIHFNFVRASQSILELQEVLCDVDKCTDVTPVLERHPRLLLCEDVRAEVEAAKARLHELAPMCDATKAVNEYPELSACAYPDAKSRSFAPRSPSPRVVARLTARASPLASSQSTASISTTSTPSSPFPSRHHHGDVQ